MQGEAAKEFPLDVKHDLSFVVDFLEVVGPGGIPLDPGRNSLQSHTVGTSAPDWMSRAAFSICFQYLQCF